MDAGKSAGIDEVVIRPSQEGDVDAMLAIYRRHIRRGVEDGVEDSGMPEIDDLKDRRKNLKSRRFPHIVATVNGAVVGYAYVVLFRKRPAYRYAVKHSIYVHHEQHGKGVGGKLMQGLIDACAAAGFRQMIGYIDADNIASLKLHERYGFVKVGHLPAVAFRYGKWSDSVMMQRSLGLGNTAPPPPVAARKP
ncbi:N-acetyltransferase family protein [Xanthobacteraceae bacterium A53D]